MVNDTDTSDKAFQTWTRETFDIYSKLACWQECRRRCEAQMEERERKAFEAGFDCGIDDLDLNECYRAFKEAQNRRALNQ